MFISGDNKEIRSFRDLVEARIARGEEIEDTRFDDARRRGAKSDPFPWEGKTGIRHAEAKRSWAVNESDQLCHKVAVIESSKIRGQHSENASELSMLRYEMAMRELFGRFASEKYQGLGGKQCPCYCGLQHRMPPK